MAGLSPEHGSFDSAFARWAHEGCAQDDNS